MKEEADFIVETTTERMNKAIEHLENELRGIRAGKASPSMLMSVMVDYYGLSLIHILWFTSILLLPFALKHRHLRGQPVQFFAW